MWGPCLCRLYSYSYNTPGARHSNGEGTYALRNPPRFPPFQLASPMSSPDLNQIGRFAITATPSLAPRPVKHWPGLRSFKRPSLLYCLSRSSLATLQPLAARPKHARSGRRVALCVTDRCGTPAAADQVDSDRRQGAIMVSSFGRCARNRGGTSVFFTFEYRAPAASPRWSRQSYPRLSAESAQR